VNTTPEERRRRSDDSASEASHREAVSVVIITKNEEANIEDCLRSVAWADEIVVVDACSEDRTVEIAREHRAKVFVRPWAGYGPQRNFGFERAAGPWLMFLDADERVTPELARRIQESTIPGKDALQVMIATRFMGHWMRHGVYSVQTRVFRKGLGRCVERLVHEGLVVDAEPERLGGELLHYSYRDLADYVDMLNRYTTLEAGQSVRQGSLESMFWLRTAWRVFRGFLGRYVVRRGYREGIHGLIWSILWGFYVLVWQLKRWERHLQAAGPADAITDPGSSRASGRAAAPACQRGEGT